LLGFIGATLTELPAAPEPKPPAEPLPPEVEPPFSLKVRAGNKGEKTPQDKKRLKAARPW
jgi:hypothetical protein